jgi:hypothetical protein
LCIVTKVSEEIFASILKIENFSECGSHRRKEKREEGALRELTGVKINNTKLWKTFFNFLVCPDI